MDNCQINFRNDAQKATIGSVNKIKLTSTAKMAAICILRSRNNATVKIKGAAVILVAMHAPIVAPISNGYRIFCQGNDGWAIAGASKPANTVVSEISRGSGVTRGNEINTG